MEKLDSLQELTNEEVINFSGGVSAIDVLFLLSPFGPAYWLGYQLGKAVS
jgi:hypothetical protein